MAASLGYRFLLILSEEFKMKKKLLFVTAIEKDESDGVWKKVLAMANAFARLNYDVDLVYREKGYGVVQNINTCTLGNIREKITFLYSKISYYNELAKLINGKYELLYIRKPLGGISSLLLGRVVNKVIKKNGNSKICMEIPTFPYRKEVRGFQGFVSEICFHLGFFFYRREISLIPYMGCDVSHIWGIPACKISNGIDLSSLKLLRSCKPKLRDTINFVAVARLSFWHGLDRLIHSIANYEGDYEVQLKIVGAGEPELSRLQNIVAELKLDNLISFTGPLHGDKLIQIYEESDIAVDSLGRHRTGTNQNSSLKSKEYTALGLPFIKSHDDVVFDNQFFSLTVSPDENDINIENVIKWYVELPVNTPFLMREFAVGELSWEKQLSYLLSFLK